MNGLTLSTILLVGYMATALLTFALLLVVDAPYGRHIGEPWQGPTINNRLAWLVMESPVAVVFGACFLMGLPRHARRVGILRVVGEPLRVPSVHLPVPLAPSRHAHAGVRRGVRLRRQRCERLSQWPLLVQLLGGYPNRWLLDLRFLVGTLVFFAGMVIGRQADATLRRLRQPGQSGYQMPRGGLFRWVSAPNYLGEIVEWGGWALATWSLPGLAFFVWVLANLVPRARAHHRWFHQHVPEYPPERRALLPGIW